MTSNGRGVVLRRFIHGTGDGIDLPKANKIVFITRRNDVVPVCARLTLRAGAPRISCSANPSRPPRAIPTKAGQAKREVGTNPFIVGPEADEGNRLLEILRENPDMQAYILNTGSIGAEGGSAGEKITIKVSTEIMKQIAREGDRLGDGSRLGLRSADGRPGLDLAKYTPTRYYSPPSTRSSWTSSAGSGATGWRSSPGSIP